MVIGCKYGTVTEYYDHLPEAPVGCRWEGVNVSYKSNIYRLIVPFTFKTENGVITLFSDVPYQDYPPVPPKLGYRGYWKIPNEYRGPITIEPVYYPERYHADFFDKGELVERVYFDITTGIEPPLLRQEQGFVKYWEPFNVEPRNMKINAVYRLPVVRLHMLDASIQEVSLSDFNEGNVPVIEGWVWSELNQSDGDYDSFIQEDIDFALFYDNRQLLYVVPYTIEDHHYVDQVLESHSIIGSIVPVNWVSLDQPGVESYVSRAQNGILSDSHVLPSFDWSIQNIIDNILEGNEFELSGHAVNLLVPKFKKYTGIGKDNIESYRLKTLTQWLNVYHIRYSDDRFRRGYLRSGCIVDENEEKVSLFGNFSIAATAQNEEYIEFLQEYGVIFEPFKKKTGELRYKLHKEAPWDGVEDPITVMDRDILHNYPHIPMMNMPETEYSSLKQSICLPEIMPIHEVSLQEAMKGNEKVVQTFELDYHPELVLMVVNESEKEVCIKKYNGSDREYEVPSGVYLDPDGSIPYYVVSIGEGCFAYSDVRRIILPDTVRELERACFIYCDNLENIRLSDNLQYIRTLAFRGCRNLQTITLPSSVVSVEPMSLWLLKEIRYACPESAIAEKACNRNNCKLINTAIHEDSIKKESSATINTDSGVDRFISALTNIEKEYLSMLIDGKETKQYLSSIGKRASVIEMSINDKLSDYLDDDEGLFPETGTLARDDDGNLEFDINYDVNLRELL